MNSTSRRRFLIDLSFVGGALALAAGVAIAGKSLSTPTCSASQDAPQHEMAGKMMVAPPKEPTKILPSGKPSQRDQIKT
jgi:hypothetical protein